MSSFVSARSRGSERPRANVRRTSRLALLLAAGILLTGATGALAASSGSAATKQKTISIGILLGPVTEGGPDFLHGMQAAIAQVNNAGGVGGQQIKLKTFQTGGTAAGAIAAYKQAAADPSLVGVFFGAVTGGLALRGQSDIVKLPIVIATANSSVDRPAAKYVFKDSFADEYATSSLVYAVQHLHAKRIAEIHYDTDYSVIIQDALHKRCAQLGCTVVDDESAAGNAPVDALVPQLTKMRAANPDAYYIEGLNPNAFAAARQLGINKPIISDQWLAIPALTDACGVNCNGVVFAIHKTNVPSLIAKNDPLRKVFLDYRARFVKKFHSWAGFSIYGNEAVLAFAKAAQELVASNKPVTRDNLADAMQHFNGDLVTTHGVIHTSPTNHRLVGTFQEAYTMVVIKVVNGKATWVRAPGASPKGATP